MAPTLVEDKLSRSGDSLGRQVRRPRANRHREGRAAAFLAGDRHAAAMKAREFLHEGQSDARAFVRAGASMLDAVEALEHARQVGFGNTDAGIGDAQLDAVVRTSAVRP